MSDGPTLSALVAIAVLVSGRSLQDRVGLFVASISVRAAVLMPRFYQLDSCSSGLRTGMKCQLREGIAFQWTSLPMWRGEAVDGLFGAEKRSLCGEQCFGSLAGHVAQPWLGRRMRAI